MSYQRVTLTEFGGPEKLELQTIRELPAPAAPEGLDPAQAVAMILSYTTAIAGKVVFDCEQDCAKD